MCYFSYLVATTLILFSSLVIFNKNYVHSVLFLIMTFINAAVLFVVLNAEFVAMLLIIVYVGAVAVLFLFIVMMLGAENIKTQFYKSHLLLLIASIVLVVELCVVFYTHNFIVIEHSSVIDTYTIAEVLYTDYFYPFQITGVILLVAMVGVITITVKPNRSLAHRQNVMKQILRKSSVRLVRS